MRAACCRRPNGKDTCNGCEGWRKPVPGRTWWASARSSRPRRGPDVADLLFEIGTEELPSWYVDEGSAALRSLLSERLEAADLPASEVRRLGTPRRLAVIARGLPARSAERVEERRGPPAAVAFDAAGAPTKAAHAFAASNQVDVTALELRETDRGSYVYASVPRGGVPAADVLPALLAQVVVDLPAPRKMRWADEPTPFLRPVSWLLALLDDEVDWKSVGEGKSRE